MTQLTISLPEPLHHQLMVLANQAGVSLNQYLVNLLTRQTTTTYAVQEVPPSEVAQQRAKFETLLQRLGTASAKEIRDGLAEREVVSPEPELTPDIIYRFRQRWIEQ